AGEYPAVALALDAVIEALSPRGPRQIPAAEFFTGLWETALEPDEVLAGVRFPVWTGRCGFAVQEFARRHGDFAIAGAVMASGSTTMAVCRAARSACWAWVPHRDARRRPRPRSSGRRPPASTPTRSATSPWPASRTFPPTCRGRRRI